MAFSGLNDSRATDEELHQKSHEKDRKHFIDKDKPLQASRDNIKRWTVTSSALIQCSEQEKGPKVTESGCMCISNAKIPPVISQVDCCHMKESTVETRSNFTSQLSPPDIDDSKVSIQPVPIVIIPEQADLSESLLHQNSEQDKFENEKPCLSSESVTASAGVHKNLNQNPQQNSINSGALSGEGFSNLNSFCVHQHKHAQKECDKILSSKDQLPNDQHTHNEKKPYECSVCGKRFTQSGHLNRHKKSHAGERPYSCSFCGTKFSNKSDLSRHQLLHTGEKPHKCTVCGKGFTTVGHVTTHLRTHTGEKPYKCTDCDKGFATSSTLTKHKRTHTGIRPHRCAVCGKEFTAKDHLTRHELVHTGEKPHKCSVCGKGFTRHELLIAHQGTHTGEMG